MVEHSLNLLLRERSKEFGRPGAVPVPLLIEVGLGISGVIYFFFL
jgi:hypothetical protein